MRADVSARSTRRHSSTSAFQRSGAPRSRGAPVAATSSRAEQAARRTRERAADAFAPVALPTRRRRLHQRQPPPREPGAEHREQHQLRALERDVGDMQPGVRNVVARDHAHRSRVEPRPQDEDLSEKQRGDHAEERERPVASRVHDDDREHAGEDELDGVERAEDEPADPEGERRRHAGRPELERRLDRRDARHESEPHERQRHRDDVLGSAHGSESPMRGRGSSGPRRRWTER